jgi:hypothetical protein
MPVPFREVGLQRVAFLATVRRKKGATVFDALDV